MGRLIYVPMLPTPGRYTSWWHTEFEKEFNKYFDEVIVLGKESIEKMKVIRHNLEQFSPIRASMLLEMDQIDDYMDLELDRDDMLFLSDLSFPGIFINALFHKPFPGRSFAYCHATSKNAYDYFNHSRDVKFRIESISSRLFERIYVGSTYHQNKIMGTVASWSSGFAPWSLKVVRLPHPPEHILPKQPIPKATSDRSREVICVGRPGIQKNNMRLEKQLQRLLGFKFERGIFLEQSEYVDFLSDSKVLFISSKEDTFNYTIMDAIACGCIPIAPNKLCFPEILPKEYLYNDVVEAEQLVRKACAGRMPIPKMLCHDEVEKFYFNLVNDMHGGFKIFNQVT